MTPGVDRKRWRDSADAAERVFERLAPEHNGRLQIAGLFAHAIRSAHEVAPASWVTTMVDEMVRLNVGPAEMMTLSPAGLRLVLHRDSDWKAIRPHVSEMSRWGLYKTLPDWRIAVFDLHRLPADLSPLFDGIQLSAAQAAAFRRKTVWAPAHAAGVVRYLERSTESRLPRPDLSLPKVDLYLFEAHLKEFVAFVSERSEKTFGSFGNDYVLHEEGYKERVFHAARAELDFRKWKGSDIGSGRIVEATIRAIEVRENNLLRWDVRNGERGRIHQKLFEARNDAALRTGIERALYSLYRGADDESAFGELVTLIGARYALIAFLFFVRDRSKYVPIATETFDRVFAYLGVDYRTTGNCGWDNYVGFISILDEIRRLLCELADPQATLLDAHSFLWILGRQMRKAGRTPDVGAYRELPATEREAITRARIGQGVFRQRLIEYWNGRCAVVGCGPRELLIASHIQPWKDAPPRERIDPFNGLLLGPALNACFDAGYVSFDDHGKILISSRLTEPERIALGIDPQMRLRRIEDSHRSFLAIHRAKYFDQFDAGDEET